MQPLSSGNGLSDSLRRQSPNGGLCGACCGTHHIRGCAPIRVWWGCAGGSRRPLRPHPCGTSHPPPPPCGCATGRAWALCSAASRPAPAARRWRCRRSAKPQGKRRSSSPRWGASRPPQTLAAGKRRRPQEAATRRPLRGHPCPLRSGGTGRGKVCRRAGKWLADFVGLWGVPPAAATRQWERPGISEAGSRSANPPGTTAPGEAPPTGPHANPRARTPHVPLLPPHPTLPVGACRGGYTSPGPVGFGPSRPENSDIPTPVTTRGIPKTEKTQPPTSPQPYQ